MNEEYEIEKPPFKVSFSQWETYSQCPAKWKYQSVLKLPRKPPGPAAARGLDIHATVEEYIKGGDSSILHEAVKPKYIPVLDLFRNHENGDRHTEKRLAFDAEWSITSYKSPLAAVVAVLDAARYANDRTLHIGEWKSGKPKDTHADQRKLYAMFGWGAWHPKRVEVTTYYLEDTAAPARVVLESENGFMTLRQVWDARISTMRRDDICAPRPSFGCRFCDFAKQHGGPCQFGG